MASTRLPKIKMDAPKLREPKKAKVFDMGKLTKLPKFTKNPKIKIIKSVIKRFKKK